MKTNYFYGYDVDEKSDLKLSDELSKYSIKKLKIVYLLTKIIYKIKLIRIIIYRKILNQNYYHHKEKMKII